MKLLNRYANLTPYLYFIAIVLYWFTLLNKSNGIIAFPILLLIIPFLWQIIKPNKELNFVLGITFVCISSYVIVAQLANVLNIPSLILAKGVIIYSGIFVFLNFAMSAWIVRNSLKQTY